MKKLLYAATALAIFAGCSKDLNEAPATVSGTKGNTIELNLAVAEDSRAIFDGDSHITWEEKDEVQAFLLESATSDKALAYAAFTFGGDNEKPIFSGKFSELDDNPDELENGVYVSGFYPASADDYKSNSLIGHRINLSTTQIPSQTSWDGKADVMLIEPTAINGTSEMYKLYGYYTYYRYTADTDIKFAHIFGFGCLTFGNIPEDVATAKVKKVVITATGENTDIAGVLLVDINKSVYDADFAISSHTPANAITLKYDATVELKDLKAYFVANPGTYDVKIDVITTGDKLSFERKGLKIERSKITSPILNFKDGDMQISQVVDLTGGKLWQHDTEIAYKATTQSNFLTLTQSEADWGTIEDMPVMAYSISCEGTTSASPSCYEFGTNSHIQRFSTSNLRFGKVILSSGSTYKGINNVMVKGGIAQGGTESCDISVFVVDKNGVEKQLGTSQLLTANYDQKDGFDYYFDSTEPIDEGSIKIVWNNDGNASTNSLPLFIRQLNINPAPAITFPEASVSIGGNGSTGSVEVNIVCATGEPTVTSDVDWLKVSYKDGIISYTAEANTGDDTRTGHIIVTATGNSTTSASIVVSQLSDKVVEFKLAIDLVPDESENANKLIAAIENAAELVRSEGGSVSAGTNLNVTTTLTATATDGSGITKDVELYFEKITYESIDRKQIRMSGGYSASNRGHICNTSSVGMFTSVTISNSSSSDGGYSNYNVVSFGTSLDDMYIATREKQNTSSPYIWISKTSEANNYGFFKMQQEYVNYIYSIELTFIAKK